MTEAALHATLTWVVLGLSVPTLLALLFVSAPYGRHARGGWGPTLPTRWGWLLMESPSSLGFAAVFALGGSREALLPLLMLALWELHYVHRTFLFPLRMRARGQRMFGSIVAMGFSFNCVNAYLNARWISELGQYGASWLQDPRFVLGATLFLVGLVVNVWADAVLFRLRGPGETGYKVPRGGLYGLVSCPNYLGELLEWFGWALLTWSLAGAAFAVYAAANLVPRALSHHRWYRSQFDDYPVRRRAVLPYLL